MATTQQRSWVPRDGGRLPPIYEDEWAHDPTYIHARLHEILTIVGEYGQHDRTDRLRREAVAFRTYLEIFTAELRLHTDAATQFLAVLDAVAPMIGWRRSMHGFTAVSREPGVAERAAHRLRIDTAPYRLNHGACGWATTIDGWEVTVVDCAMQRR